jgi:hypothetical protein
VLLAQISSRQTLQLLQALETWPVQTMRHFLLVIFGAVSLIWRNLIMYGFLLFHLLPKQCSFDGRSQIIFDLSDVYRRALPTGEAHSFVPFVDFISQVVRLRPAARIAVLDAGFTDVLMCMYARDFIDPVHNGGDHERRRRKPALLAACDSILLELMRHNECASVISNHHICYLWPQNGKTGPIKTPNLDDRGLRRHQAWKLLDEQLQAWRLDTICNALAIHTTSDEERMDVFIDLLCLLK